MSITRSLGGVLILGFAATVSMPLVCSAHAQEPAFGAHGYSPGRAQAPISMGRFTTTRTDGGYVGYIDLTSLAPPVGIQGPIASCASWVTSEYLYDFTDLPATSDRAAARPYRVAGAEWLYWAHADEGMIEGWMKTTHRPVVFSLDIYHNLDYAGHNDGAGVSYPLLIQSPTPGMQFRGGHIVIGYRTDANGVWFMNSWGTAYGRDGWVELSWSFIREQVIVYVLRSHSFENSVL